MSGKPDDSSLTPAQLLNVREHARRALLEAGADGVFPTPVDDILLAANVERVEHEPLTDGLLSDLRSKAGRVLKRAVSKVLGVFVAKWNLVFIDKLLVPVKQRFVMFHEAGHSFMPWQRAMYDLVEDCDQALDSDTAELFDREANVFASEVLFQNNAFSNMAADQTFEIWTPIRLAKTFDASLYASIRQYVSKNDRCCAVLVLDPPVLSSGGFRANLRRVVTSDSFLETFGKPSWPDVYTPDDPLGALVPLAPRKASGKRSLVLKDRNGVRHEFIAESFTQTYQVFILIHAVKMLPTSIVVPGE